MAMVAEQCFAFWEGLGSARFFTQCFVSVLPSVRDDQPQSPHICRELRVGTLLTFMGPLGGSLDHLQSEWQLGGTEPSILSSQAGLR